MTSHIYIYICAGVCIRYVCMYGMYVDVCMSINCNNVYIMCIYCNIYIYIISSAYALNYAGSRLS